MQCSGYYAMAVIECIWVLLISETIRFFNDGVASGEQHQNPDMNGLIPITATILLILVWSYVDTAVPRKFRTA